MKLIDEKGRLFGKINLIDLLVVLMRPLIRRSGCGQCVQRRAFQKVSEQGVAGQRQKHLIRIHRFYNAAKLRPLNG